MRTLEVFVDQNLCLLIVFQELFAAGEEKFGTDEDKFINILGNRSAEHLRKGARLYMCVQSLLMRSEWP